jgi:hypothetical protein
MDLASLLTVRALQLRPTMRTIAALVFCALAGAACGDASQGSDWEDTAAGGDGSPGSMFEDASPVSTTHDAGTDAPPDEPSPPRDAGSSHDAGSKPEAGGSGPKTNSPLAPIVGYEQINLTETCGSCGSHAGAISLGFFSGDTSTSAVTAIEQSVYSNFGLPCRPGASSLAAVYNDYLAKKGLPWKAVVFTSSSDVQSYIDKGSPVVANTVQWGGHYVAIYGLKASSSGTMMVYFSDGTTGTGLSGSSLPTGNLKEWTWSSFLSDAASGEYIGFAHQ